MTNSEGEPQAAAGPLYEKGRSEFKSQGDYMKAHEINVGSHEGMIVVYGSEALRDHILVYLQLAKPEVGTKSYRDTRSGKEWKG